MAKRTLKLVQVAVCTMKEFRDQIDGDERMLKFAADNLDAPDDAQVKITIDGQFVTYERIEDE